MKDTVPVLDRRRGAALAKLPPDICDVEAGTARQLAQGTNAFLIQALVSLIFLAVALNEGVSIGGGGGIWLGPFEAKPPDHLVDIGALIKEQESTLPVPGHPYTKDLAYIAEILDLPSFLNARNDTVDNR